MTIPMFCVDDAQMRRNLHGKRHTDWTIYCKPPCLIVLDLMGAVLRFFGSCVIDLFLFFLVYSLFDLFVVFSICCSFGF